MYTPKSLGFSPLIAYLFPLLCAVEGPCVLWHGRRKTWLQILAAQCDIVLCSCTEHGAVNLWVEKMSTMERWRNRIAAIQRNRNSSESLLNIPLFGKRLQMKTLFFSGWRLTLTLSRSDGIVSPGDPAKGPSRLPDKMGWVTENGPENGCSKKQKHPLQLKMFSVFVFYFSAITTL